jgi:hypothetical protein
MRWDDGVIKREIKAYIKLILNYVMTVLEGRCEGFKKKLKHIDKIEKNKYSN